MNINGYEHTPVLLHEVLQGLNIQPDGCYVDCTFGRGGHSKMILQQLDNRGRVFAIDRDPHAIESLDEQLRNDPRFRLFHGRFSTLRELAVETGITGKVNGLLFDLGVSSPQLDDAERGFSFGKDAPLDMRMDNSGGQTAAEWLGSAKEAEIAEVIREYGEEKFARRIARAIVHSRAEQKIETTSQLSTLVAAVIPVHEKDKHPATRTFQAIRIFINQELEELRNVLVQTLDVLAGGGRLLVISFHSLEDRIVKRFMRDESRGDKYPPEIPVTQDQMKPALKIINKVIYPAPEEIARNPRARSAVLRIAERVRS